MRSGFYGYLDLSKSADKVLQIDKQIGDLHLAIIENKKFFKDSTSVDNESIFIIIDGVRLNLSDLLLTNKCKDAKELYCHLYNKKGFDFYKYLEGTFNGLIYNKIDNSLLLFSDTLGSRLLYYSLIKNDKFLFSTDIYKMAEMRKQFGYNNNISRKGAYCFLTYGFLIEDLTFIENVHKVVAGEIVSFENNSFKKEIYYRYKYDRNFQISTTDAIEEVDRLFYDAIKQQINKNKDYGYDDFAALSAGLDSRVVNFFVHDILQKPFYSFTYSQSDFFDDTTSKKIANDLKNHWIFKPLDNGNSLYCIEDCVEINGGAVTNYGAAQVFDMFTVLNKDRLGLVHSGMIGDKVLDSWINSNNINKVEQYNIGEGAYSRKYLNKLCNEMDGLQYNYDNYEQGIMYCRGLSGANMGGPIIIQSFSDSFAPFLNKKLLEFTGSLPLEIIMDNKLYYSWVKTKHPEMTTYLRNGAKMQTKGFLKYKGSVYSLEEFAKRSYNKIFKGSSLNTKNHMNPLGYWYENNIQLRSFLDDKFIKNVDYISDIELKKDCLNLYNTGTPVERDMALTLSVVINKIFSR